jgi:hypothetical protein
MNPFAEPPRPASFIAPLWPSTASAASEPPMLPTREEASQV